MTAVAQQAQGMKKTLAAGEPGRRLGFDRLLRLLGEEGHVAAEEVTRLCRDASLSSADRHPLVMIAERQLRSLLTPHRPRRTPLEIQ